MGSHRPPRYYARFYNGTMGWFFHPESKYEERAWFRAYCSDVQPKSKRWLRAEITRRRFRARLDGRFDGANFIQEPPLIYRHYDLVPAEDRPPRRVPKHNTRRRG